MGHEEHKRKAPKCVRCKVITVSDTRDEESDSSGRLIRDMLDKEGHEIVCSVIIKDDICSIKDELSTNEADVFILNGGTGISKRDVSPDAVRDIIDTELDGFGELFRSFSYDEIGSAAILSRAVAGINDRKLVFSLPGSKNAVKLAMEKLILPELGHLVYEVKK